MQNSFSNNAFEITQESLIFYFENKIKLEVEKYVEKVEAIRNRELICYGVEDVNEIIDDDFQQNIMWREQNNFWFYLLKIHTLFLVDLISEWEKFIQKLLTLSDNEINKRQVTLLKN